MNQPAWLIGSGITVLILLIIMSLLVCLLIRQRRIFLSLFEYGMDGLAVVNKKGTVLFLNKTAPALLHRPRKDLLGKLFIAPNECSEVTEISVKGKEGKPSVLEIRKGRIHWHGQSAWLLQFRDVTRRKKLEAEIRQQEERFQAMTINVPGVVYQWAETREGICRYNYISPRCEELLGITAQQLKQEWFVPRLYPKGVEHWNEALQNAQNPDIDWSFVRTLTNTDGTTHWVRDLSRAQASETEVLFNGVLIDITAEKKQTEKLEQARNQAEEDTRKEAARNREMRDSINYASRIQRCILPNPEAVISQFREAFIYLRPRDVVSGDFYWYSRVGDCRILICADCTGHGVPGAFMTLLGNDLFEYVVNDRHILEPSAILEETNRLLAELMSASGQRIRDGLEAAVCCIENNKLRFAGARLHLYRVHNRKLEQIAGTRRAIGEKKSAPVFQEHVISVDLNDTFYMATDGFQDQFGGTKGKKYMRGAFRTLLQETAKQPISQQARLLNSELEKWKQDQPQIDDILIIGFQC